MRFVWPDGWRLQNLECSLNGICHLQAVCYSDKKLNFSDSKFLHLRDVVKIKYDGIKCLAQCMVHSRLYCLSGGGKQGEKC